jgi:hypothetical protein
VTACMYVVRVACIHTCMHACMYVCGAMLGCAGMILCMRSMHVRVVYACAFMCAMVCIAYCYVMLWHELKP